MFVSFWSLFYYDDVIKWKHVPRYWPFVRGIHWSLVNSPHKGQWRRTLTFSLICAWINRWVNNGEAGDLRRYRSHPLWRHCNDCRYGQLTAEAREEVGYMCKRLLDCGRVHYLQTHGFNTQLVRYTTSEISLENVALLATAKHISS